MIKGIDDPIQSFHTPIRFDGEMSIKQHIIQSVECYFQMLCNKTAFVLKEQPTADKTYVEIRRVPRNETVADYLLLVAKIISVATIIFPILMLLAKGFIRYTNNFEVQPTNAVKTAFPGNVALSSALNPQKYDNTTFWGKIHEAKLQDIVTSELDSFFKGSDKQVLEADNDTFYPDQLELLSSLNKVVTTSQYNNIVKAIDASRLY